MRNETPDRQQMHEELQELAKLAGTPGAGAAREQAHAFESADSSGYVDLSAYRGDDESWIERELARAKAGVGPSGQRAIDGLAPQSMAPVAMEALLAADAKLEDDDPPPPRRRWPVALGAIASVAAVAGLAFVVTRNAPRPAAAATQAAAPPPVATQPATSSEPATTQEPAVAPHAPPAPTVAAAVAQPSAEPAAKKPHSTHASRGHASAPAAVASKPAAARPVAIPASRPVQSSGDSLMDAIRASVKK